MKNRGMFWLIWAVAFFPMLLAMVSYFGGVGQPQARVNNGQLVAAGMTLETLQLKSEQGIPYQADGTWRLLLLVGPALYGVRNCRICMRRWAKTATACNTMKYVPSGSGLRINWCSPIHWAIW